MIDCEFIVRLCFDVLLDVLRYGDRDQLAGLEYIGRRLHFLIDKHIKGAPFLRLDLYIKPWYLYDRLKFRKFQI